jgi:hypothetical protein
LAGLRARSGTAARAAWARHTPGIGHAASVSGRQRLCQGLLRDGILFLILGAIGAIVTLAFIRMTLEIYYAIVRMAEDTHRRLPGA